MVKVKLNKAGFRALRTDPRVAADLERRAQAVRAALGDGWQVEDPGTESRERRTIVPGTAEAAFDSAREPSRVIAALNAARHA